MLAPDLAAARLGCSRPQLLSLSRLGLIPSYDLGSGRRGFAVADFEVIARVLDASKASPHSSHSE